MYPVIGAARIRFADVCHEEAKEPLPRFFRRGEKAAGGFTLKPASARVLSRG
jgi:hypothetical protein